MTYALPANMTGFVSWFTYANSVTDGLFGSLVLLLIAGVLFITFMTFEDTKRSFMGASIIAALFGVIFFIIGFVNAWALSLSIGLALVSVLYSWMSNEYVG